MGSGVATLGRTPDNSVSFPDDPNVSRYHAEIELRGLEYCLIDLNSSNGTSVNGQPVAGERYLSDGDLILLGGSSELIFEKVKNESESNAAGAAPSSADPEPEKQEAADTVGGEGTAAAAGGSSAKMLLLAGGVLGLAVVFAGSAGLVYYLSGSSCDATASILSPENGDNISKPTEVELDLSKGGCVANVIYTIDGIEFARSSDLPFSATIDPSAFPDLADGGDHPLSVVLEDHDGNRLPQSSTVLIAFETRAIAKPTPGSSTGVPQPGATPETARKAEVSLIEINDMSRNLLKQFSGGDKINVANRQLLQEIQRRTAEYAEEGYYERAAGYRDAINVAFVREQNLDAPLGFVLAMSRSRFSAAAQGPQLGLWRMTNEFATTNAYIGLCGTETIGDASQNCAAKATALYMKALIFSVFDGDVVYSVAAFGKSTQEAGVWKTTLPANRSDIAASIKTAPEREQLVRFIAAGIVAENPHKFGLGRDRPLSQLYRVAM